MGCNRAQCAMCVDVAHGKTGKPRNLAYLRDKARSDHRLPAEIGEEVCVEWHSGHGEDAFGRIEKSGLSWRRRWFLFASCRHSSREWNG